VQAQKNALRIRENSLPALCYNTRMKNNEDLWKIYTGDMSTADFMCSFRSRSPEKCVALFLRDCGHVYGIVRRGNWRETFAAEAQYQRQVVFNTLLARLEEKREEWEPAVEEKIHREEEERRQHEEAERRRREEEKAWQQREEETRQTVAAAEAAAPPGDENTEISGETAPETKQEEAFPETGPAPPEQPENNPPDTAG
jgi:flagellar biosynthesis GTPase FlhF